MIVIPMKMRKRNLGTMGLLFVDIISGEKTVLQYLLQPVQKLLTKLLEKDNISLNRRLE